MRRTLRSSTTSRLRHMSPIVVPIMSQPSTYLLVSLPTSISSSGHKDDALSALGAAVTADVGPTSPFNIPTFKIGTLDALVQQADDLTKLSNACEAVVGKVGDSLKGIFEGDQNRLAQQKTINDSMRSLLAFSANHVLISPQNPLISISSLSSGTR